MVNVYAGEKIEEKEQWELLETFTEAGEANKYVQHYLEKNVPKLMFLKQWVATNTEFKTLVIDYGFDKYLLIEDTTRKEEPS